MPHSNVTTKTSKPSAVEAMLDELVTADCPQQKTLLEKNRVALSWVSCLSLVGCAAMTQSQWSITGLMSGTLLLVGLCFAVVGCVGRIWCSLFIDGFKTKQLVTCGPYSICRNPLYFFSAIGALGVAFGTATFSIPAVVAIGFGFYYPLIIRAEERRLVELHGAEFEAYRNMVPAFFPRLSGLVLPRTYQIHVKIVGRSMLEATWFIWFTMIAHLLYQLHQRTNILPSVLQSL